MSSSEGRTETARLGAALAGRCTIQRELGRGGMATVFLAEERHPRRLVALKVLDPALAAALDPERFLREIQLNAKLDHRFRSRLRPGRSGVIGATLVVSLVLVAGLSCGGPDISHYRLEASALGNNFSGLDKCDLRATIPLRELPREWTGEAELGFGRTRVRNERLQTDTVEHQLVWTTLSHNGDSVVVEFRDLVPVAMLGVLNDHRGYQGVWICDNSAPFADDSSRAVEGYFFLTPAVTPDF